MADTSLSENRIGLLIWKTSNYWQTRLRKILRPHNLSLNEFLILESIHHLNSIKSKTHQNVISSFIGIDISVASVTFKSLENKNYISRQFETNNRKKIVKMLDGGKILFENMSPLIKREEKLMFEKLKNETFNFTNSLKLLLGKKIRIKAEQ